LDKTFDFESKDVFKIYYSASNYDTGFYIQQKTIYDSGKKKVGEVKQETADGASNYIIVMDPVKDNKIDERTLMQNMIIDGAKIGNKIDLEKANSVTDAKKQPELSIVFMQVSAPTKTGVLKNTLTAIGIPVAGSFATAPVLSGKLVQLAVQGAKAHPYVAIAVGASLLISGSAQLVSTERNRAVAAGYCGDVSVGDEAREGCSVVRAMDYGVKDIGDYCSYVESIP
jgi:hypothetical protein